MDSYAKLVWKCGTRSSILFICNTFCCRLILLSSLNIELALVCCTNPDNVNCFWTIFPNLNFVFASICQCAARSVHIQSDQYRSCSTVNNVKTRGARGATPGIHPDGEQPKTALWLWVRKITWYLYTRWVHGRMKAKQRWFKVTREVCHEWFHHFRHHVHDGHCHLASTLFHSLVPWRQRRIRPQITRLSQLGELRNGDVANLQELYYTRLVKKMALYKNLIHVLIV